MKKYFYIFLLAAMPCALETQAQSSYTIPVVFHVLHQYGPEDISDAQILDAIRILSEDFSKRNIDTNQVKYQFRNQMGNAHIQFQLATIDPNGQPTNGIDRIYTVKTNNASDNSKLNDWPSCNYLNIWTVASLQLSGSAGYGYSPAMAAAAPSLDGIIILSDHVGSIGTGSTLTDRVFTHETGHYLGLYDIVDSCHHICDTTQACPGVINFQDFMTNNYCSYMFSKNEAASMDSVIQSGRGCSSNISDTANLRRTGVSPASTIPPAPVADFLCNKQIICKGDSAGFTDYSWKGTPSSWTWIARGSASGTYTAQNPTITYDSTGVFDVQLIAKNNTGADTVIKKSTVFVFPDTAMKKAPYRESFEKSSLQVCGWNEINVDKDNYEWQVTSSAAYNGSNCAYLSNYNQPDSLAKDVLISPSVDFSAATAPVLAFRYAYARTKTYSGDVLKIYYSDNCGTNWLPVSIINAANMNTISSPVAGPFTPADTTQWKEKILTLNSSLIGSPNVIFKFEFTGGLNGNNLFLDDIGFYNNASEVNQPIAATSSIAAPATAFNLFPNPSGQSSMLSFTLAQNAAVKIKLTDISGRTIAELVNAHCNTGRQQLEIPHQQSGIYFLNITVDNSLIVKKIIFN